MRRPRLQPARRLCQKLLRQLTLWVGLVCVFAQFSGAVHELLVEHVRCAEHGDWVHAPEEHGAAPGTATEPDSRALTSALPQQSDDLHGHEHCLVWSDRHDQALAPPSRLELAVTGSNRTTAIVGARAFRASNEVYSFAPKTSPPISNRS